MFSIFFSLFRLSRFDLLSSHCLSTKTSYVSYNFFLLLSTIFFISSGSSFYQFYNWSTFFPFSFRLYFPFMIRLFDDWQPPRIEFVQEAQETLIAVSEIFPFTLQLETKLSPCSRQFSSCPHLFSYSQPSLALSFHPAAWLWEVKYR